MFKKYYKSANDDIKPNREIIDKVFEKAEEEGFAKKAKVYSFSKRYATAIAAVLVLVISLAIYPELQKSESEYTAINTQNTQLELKKEDDILQFSADKKSSGAESAENAKLFDYTNNAKEQSLEAQSVEQGEPSKARSLEPEGQAFDEKADNGKEFEVLLNDLAEVANEETEKMTSKLIANFGSADENTGNEYIFEIVGKAEFSGNNFYIARWRWWVEDHSSLITTLAFNQEVTEIYECIYIDGKIFWSTENNLIK